MKETTLPAADGRWLELEKTLRSSLHLLESKRLRLKVPAQSGLFRRHPGSHYHPTPEVFFQTGGATDFDCPAESFRLETGQVCIMPRGVPHHETPVDLKTPYSILVCCQGAEATTFIRAHSPNPGIIRGFNTAQFKNKRVVEAFFYMDQISLQQALDITALDRFSRGALELFLITLLCELGRDDQQEPSQDPRVLQVEQLVRDKLVEPDLSVARLARAVRCSPDHLTRLFRRERGLSLQTWLLRERVSLARHLLQHSTHNIAEVSWACGFNSPSYFIRVFRRFCQTTPRSYRTLHGGSLDSGA